MKNIRFKSGELFSFHLCGKFEAPNQEWMHLTRNLTDFELMAVTDGVLYIADEYGEYALKKGEYMLMPPTKNQHGHRTGACSFYWLHFDLPSGYEIIDGSDAATASGFTVIPVMMKNSRVDRLIILMKQLQDCDRRYHNFTLNSAITTSILTELSCQYSYSQAGAQILPGKQIVGDIMDFAKYHCCENITVGDIANYFGYNSKYLSSLFKRNLGVSLKQYIIQTKMDAAKAQLSDTNHTISQIAYNLGFSDPHNFTNSFKKITGLSPSDYRQGYEKRSLFYE